MFARLLPHATLVLLSATCIAVSAQPSPAAPAAPAASTPAIPYATVADALKALQARDGNDTIVVHSDDGWVIVNEPGASAQWSFTPPNNPAYPAVVRRIIHHGPNRSVSVETSSVCEADAEACGKLLGEFAALNARVTQAVTGRGAGGPPPMAPTPPSQP